MGEEHLRDVADVVLRLLHVVAGIAWIGASFYFIRLDLGLRRPERPEDEARGVGGEYWGVHGGGFYHSQKYKVAPPRLPEHLHWFKWEAYTTWLSGFALLILLYWLDAETRLVDPGVADLAPWQAVALSAGGLAGAWIVYDVACRALRDDRAVAGVVVALVVGSAWGASLVFAPRAAFLQVGAMLGTIMAANVFFSIIPAHRELIRAKEAGRDPDAAPGVAAKQRSVHNNYLTLPVVFTMLAGHFPVVFGAERPWLVLVAIFVLLALTRHFFNRFHTGRRPWWILGVVAAGTVALALLLAPGAATPAWHVTQRRSEIASASSSDGLRAHAAGVRRQVSAGLMPPGNTTGMTEDEREQLVAWAAAAR